MRDCIRIFSFIIVYRRWRSDLVVAWEELGVERENKE